MNAAMEKSASAEEATLRDWPRLLLQGILALALFMMMTVTFVDVVGRYVFNSPLSGAKELTELLLMVVVFGAAPLVTAANEHITTTLFDEISSNSMRRSRAVSISAMSAGACAVLCWQCWVQGNVAAGLDARTPLLNVPTAPFIYFMSVMSAVCALILLIMTLRGFTVSTSVQHVETDPTI